MLGKYFGVSARYEGPASSELAEIRRQLNTAEPPLAEWAEGDFRFAIHVYPRNILVVVHTDDGQPLALRSVYLANGHLAVHHVEREDGVVRIEATCETGAFRVQVHTRTRNGLTTLRSRTALVPSHDLRLSFHPRDLTVLETQGESPQTTGRLYSTQHGFQTGSLFAACPGERGSAFFYVQNFTSLHKYFEDTCTTPQDTVGGAWPEIGFLLPISEEHPLLASNEYTISDAYVVLRSRAPVTEGEAALYYLDALAQVASLLEPPERAYRNWPARAYQTVYDLSHSPECTNVVDGKRYLAPYVGVTNKPPESMVQLTMLVALLEYQSWSGSEFTLARDLLDNLDSFFNDELKTIVRWLPGSRFEDREDDHQRHEAMDSWYLYHILFNIARLTEAGNATARKIFEQSLPYAIRVAKRFAYRWPIFFHLETLDVIQAEAQKGSGGENDVSGLYALVMLHAHEIFQDDAYLEEAKRAADALAGFGFGLAYQANTTGFAAEATLRLWKKTGERRYFDLTMVALANIFDNMSLWEPGYGNAQWYSTYFGLYPLRGAPYIAPYEELEALAKFHFFLGLGGDDLPASVTLLMSEFVKWFLSRAWFYFPSELPEHVLAKKQRNGTVRRELAIPLEDLQDGLNESGEVGQEIYGAGLALVCATRQYVRFASGRLLLFCEYPLRPLGKTRFRIIGDPGMKCTVRVIPAGPNVEVPENAIAIAGSKRQTTARTVEGHIAYEARGGDIISVRSRRGTISARRSPKR